MASDLQQRRAQIDAALGALPLAPGTTAHVARAEPPSVVACAAPARGHAVILYFHGGGYRMGSAWASRSFASHLAAVCGAEVLVVDYRLAPEHPFPAAVDDAVTAYRWLLERPTRPEHVVVVGDSAGGGLGAALLLRARDEGLPLPAGAALLSPWLDLTNSGESFDSRGATDALFSRAAAEEAAGMYLAGADAAEPYASPLFGEWRGLPPLLLQASDDEVLLDDACRLAERATAAGVEVALHRYAGVPHVWHLQYPALPEAVAALDQLAAFLARHV